MDCRPLIIEFKFAVMRSEGRDSIGSTYVAQCCIAGPARKCRL